MGRIEVVVAVCLLVALAVSADAREKRRKGDLYGDSTWDYRSGNSYDTSGDGYRGYNVNTGSQWSSRTEGSTTYGVDSHGNYWSYDRESGMYYNSGTGEVRTRGKKW